MFPEDLDPLGQLVIRNRSRIRAGEEMRKPAASACVRLLKWTAGFGKVPLYGRLGNSFGNKIDFWLVASFHVSFPDHLRFGNLTFPLLLLDSTVACGEYLIPIVEV